MKEKIERTCSLCGAKFKCEYSDEMSKAFAEMCEICPECWKIDCFVRERKKGNEKKGGEECAK